MGGFQVTNRRDRSYPRYELLEPEFLRRMAKIVAEGEPKHGAHNWKGVRGDQTPNTLRRAVAHLYQHLMGDRSEDHLGHAACSIMAATRHELDVASKKTASRRRLCVYLAVPIDAAKSPESWRHEIKKVLREHGITCYDPYSAFSLAEMSASRYVLDINSAALRASDVVVAYLPKDVCTVGTVLEIKECMDHGIPVIVVSDVEYVALRGLTRVESLEQVEVAVLSIACARTP